ASTLPSRSSPQATTRTSMPPLTTSPQVEQALDGFEVPPQPLPEWDWMVTDIRLAEVETDFSPEGEKVVGATRLTYAITYETAPKMAEDGQPPARVFIGYDPKIGAAHEDDYTELT
ncbi:MAG: hypothetical protein AB1918_15500, partial [Pseudomonadota bacterium]